MFDIRTVVIIAAALWIAQPVGPPTLESALQQFDRHNYKAALDTADQVLTTQPDESTAIAAGILRVKCLFKLNEFDAGIAALNEIIQSHPALDERADLHETAAEALQNRHDKLADALNRWRRVFDLKLAAGDKHGAAVAAIQCGTLLIGFGDWENLQWPDVQPPDDPAAVESLRRSLADAWLTRGIDLTDDSAVASAAMYTRAMQTMADWSAVNDDAVATIHARKQRFEELIERFPESKEAPLAEFEIARLLEVPPADYVATVKRYDQIIKRYAGTRYATRAEADRRRITSPQLQLPAIGPVLPDGVHELQVHVRNINAVQFRVYRVDLFDYARADHDAEDRESNYIDRAAEWSIDVSDTGEHRYLDTTDGTLPTIRLPELPPGAYVLFATGTPTAGKPVIRSTLVLVTRLAAVVKAAQNDTLVWAVDAVTGEPKPNVDVLVKERFGQNGVRFHDGRTDADGILELTLDNHREGGSRVEFFLRDGDHVAAVQGAMYLYGQPSAAQLRAYSMTDRPIYRPGQTVHFKHVVRQYDDGTYQTVPPDAAAVTIMDPQGQTVFEKTMRTDERGAVVGEFLVPTAAPLGIYRFNVTVGGQYVMTGSGGVFRVEEYRKPEFEVTVSAGDGRHALDQPVDVRVEARYYFGSPVADAELTYTIHRGDLYPRFRYPSPYTRYFDDLRGDMRGCGMPWWPGDDHETVVQRGTLRTDADGTVLLRIDPSADLPTDAATGGGPFAGGQIGHRYRVDVDVTDNSRRTVSGSGAISVTKFPFALQLRPQRWWYELGDTIHVDIDARSADDEPVAFKGTARVYRLVSPPPSAPGGVVDDGRGIVELVTGDQVAEGAVESAGPESAVLRFTADEAGPFRVVVTAATDGEPQPTGQCDIWISKPGQAVGKTAYRDVEIVLDKTVYDVGDTARLLIHSRFDDARALLTYEIDELLEHRIIRLTGGGGVVEFPVTKRHTPNFQLVATMVHDQRVFEDRRSVIVPPTDRFLTVDVSAPADEFKPGDETEVVMTATDATGEPAAADLAVMMVDASLYAIQPEFREAVQKFFYGQLRYHGVQTQTSLHTDQYSYKSSDRRGGEAGLFSSVAGDMAMEMAAPASADGFAMAKQAPGSGGAEFAVAAIRRKFPDSVVWLGHVQTGADGKASVPIQFPDTLTTWRLTAVAIDDDTRVGEASHEFVTRKNVIARLQTPRFLVQGDRATISVIARNDLKQDKKMRVELKSSPPILLGDVTPEGAKREITLRVDVDVDVTIFGVESGYSNSTRGVEFNVPAGAERVVDFAVTADAPGDAVFKATVQTDVESDAVELTIPIIPFGAQQLQTFTGIIREGDEVTSEVVNLTIPDEIDAATPIVEIHINPTIAGVILDAIPYLLDYPYGCVEQTMSRFLPAVVTRHTLNRMGVKLETLAGRIAADPTPPDGRGRRGLNDHPVFRTNVMDTIVANGLARLAELQSPDGGWGWFHEGASDPYMTAYVVYGLAEARRADVTIDPAMLDRGVAVLKSAIATPDAFARSWRGANDANVRMWMLYALATVDPGLLRDAPTRTALDQAFEKRDDLTDYTRAMLAIALHAAGDRDRAAVVIENLENTVHVDETTQTASWGHRTGYRFWYDNGLESTAMVLRALLAVAPDHKHVNMAGTWLVRNRQGAHWYSTKDTAFAIYALTDYLLHTGELDADMTVTVTYDRDVKRSFRITPENVLTFDARMILAPQHVTPGKHTVRIDKDGRGTVYHATYADYYTRQDPIHAAGHDIIVKRGYARLIPKQVERTRRIWNFGKRRYIDETYQAIDYDREPISDRDALSAGDLVEVALDIDSRNAFEYILIEDPKPAGCEPADLLSGADYGDPASVGQSLYVYRELRDRHVAFFASYLPQGTHRLTYRVRCETPGAFRVLPTQLSAMYSPYVRSNAASDRWTIKP
ncbi:MAG: hypothetical protein HOP29_15795 [Phycisphaerales bacterium]|nr:hypothetical protein [Phycisphaerales bacterium]